MKRNDLPTRWIRWRLRRYQTLFAEGLAGPLAWELAKGEAKGRHRIAGILGEQAARDAVLVVIGEGEQVRFALRGGGEPITDEQRAALAKSSASPSIDLA